MLLEQGFTINLSKLLNNLEKKLKLKGRGVLFDYEHMKMSEFETYSYPCLVRTQGLEFYFIRGVNNSQEFSEDWDCRLIEVLGYFAAYMKKGELKIFIYLIKDETKNFKEIIRHVKMFASELYTYKERHDKIKFIMKSTNVYQRGLGENEIMSFVKKIVKNDIPGNILDEIQS